MAVSRTLRRLLRIRSVEEEQSRLALESALSEFNRLEHAMTATGERARRGRRLVEASARSGELTDRLAGLEETRAAGRYAAALAPRIADAELNVSARRQEFLSKRVERRQAETLIQEAEAQSAVEAGRRGQQALDDWYGNRLHRTEAEAEPGRGAEPGLATPGSLPQGSDLRTDGT
jgi:flagellar biosynthesis chaperone FliJ